MKSIAFTKMSGAGNDFIIIKDQPGLIYRKLAVKACDRTDGIGADGILVLGPSRNADFRMRIFNADGSEAEMCGNGVRCLAAYINRKKNPKKALVSIETKAGIIMTKVQGQAAEVRLSDPKDYQPDIPLEIGGRTIHVHYIDTGVPHTIVYVDDLAGIDVPDIGRTIRFHPRFRPRGTNVNFVEQLGPASIAIRTYERGVENETKACGTGSTAAALVSFVKANPRIENKTNIRINVSTRSGETLKVKFNLQNGMFNNVRLAGKVLFIAEGKYFLDQ